MVVTKEALESKVGEYLAEVRRTGRSLIVTDGGRQVLEVRSLPETPSAVSKRVTVAEVLAEYRRGGGRGIIPDEEELMRPQPIENWEVLRDDDRNPW